MTLTPDPLNAPLHEIHEQAADLSAKIKAARQPEEFTEYGYLVEYPDGTRCFMSFLGTDRERALGQFNTLEVGLEAIRLVFVSRRVTQSPWTEESR